MTKYTPGELSKVFINSKAEVDSSLSALFEKSAGASILFNKTPIVNTIKKNSKPIATAKDPVDEDSLSKLAVEDNSDSEYTSSDPDHQEMKELMKNNKTFGSSNSEKSAKTKGTKKCTTKKGSAKTEGNEKKKLRSKPNDSEGEKKKIETKQDDSEIEKKKIETKQDDPEIEKKKIETKPDDPEKLGRTLFVGNVHVDALTKSGSKKFQQFFRPFGAIESVRFRSIALNKPMNRRIAIINKQLHEGRDSINAYIVFVSKEGADKALEANGKEVMGKHIRVDRVDKPKGHNTRNSVFIGNLPFSVTEEQLYSKFVECGEIENVRVVRDKATNVGKGFGYVQFKDISSVSLALSLHETPFEKKSLRVFRCLSEKAKQKKSENKFAGQKRGHKEASDSFEGEHAKKGAALRIQMKNNKKKFKSSSKSSKRK